MAINKKFVNKDKSVRSNFKYFEEYYLILNLINNNNKFKNSIRWKSQCLLHIFSKISKVKSSNRCVLTGRSSNFNKNVRFSRVQFFKISREGIISGLIKATW